MNIGLVTMDVEIEDKVRLVGLVLAGAVDLKREPRRHFAPDQRHLGAEPELSPRLMGIRVRQGHGHPHG